jgi:hypothetical protein
LESGRTVAQGFFLKITRRNAKKLKKIKLIRKWEGKTVFMMDEACKGILKLPYIFVKK